MPRPAVWPLKSNRRSRRPPGSGRLSPGVRACLLVALACSLPLAATGPEAFPGAKPESSAPSPLDAAAESYVRLVLAMGEHDADYVDAYYGPPDWREEVRKEKLPLAEIRRRAESLVAGLAKVDLAGAEELVRLRGRYLDRQLRALTARIAILQGEKLSFDQESRALYDATAPRKSERAFRETLADLEKLLPGEGPLIDRFEAFRKEFVIPRDRLGAVFTAAIEEARRRTKQRIPLPEEESFTVEYVTGKPWSAYNWYQGNARSVIQVNTDLPILIDRAVDLAAHEGYPGHHVYNVLLERHLVRERGWVEFTVYPLFSPQSLIAEGSANYGVEVAFPGAEHLAFVRDVLFPLAGLDPARAAAYEKVRERVEGLDFAGNEAARHYLDSEWDRQRASDWLIRFALMPPDRAAQRMRFIDTYRSYVINYNVGRELVRRYIEGRGGTADHPDRRWEEFRRLLASPRLPSDLS